MTQILQKNEKVLREVTQIVPLDTIDSPEIKKVIHDMKEALSSQTDGVALAAPQIGVSKRIFIISGKVLDSTFDPQRELSDTQIHEDLVFINPEITSQSKEKELMPEGCLSVRYTYGKVWRASKTTVRAYDEHGRLFERGSGGIISQIFQHEIDHLNGILFIDKAADMEDIPPAVHDHTHNGDIIT
ncbi:peptide deformylase [Candidatus Wolfebacteria bacterium]|nr:MAG: peptide deformylase [Candidatus Wolfebacteria bacterium]